MTTRSKTKNLAIKFPLILECFLLVVQIPFALRNVDKTPKIVKEEMERTIKLSAPLVVDTKIEKNWAEMRE